MYKNLKEQHRKQYRLKTKHWKLIINRALIVQQHWQHWIGSLKNCIINIIKH